MKRRNIIIIISIFSLVLINPVYSAIIADSSAVGEFSQIPSQWITGARNLRMILYHASLGENIKTGLNTLYSSNSAYNWNNWNFVNRANPDCNYKVTGFQSNVNQQSSNYNVFMMKFCFVDVLGWNCPSGYTVDQLWNLYRNTMVSLESQYPNKDFVWWTMPLKTSDSASYTAYRDGFNDRVRSYCQQNNKILFDMAAIESNNGQCTSGGHEALCTSYDTDGGHLNNAGSERTAKALWWLMARIAGWQSGSVTTTTSSTTITTVYTTTTSGGTTTTTTSGGTTTSPPRSNVALNAQVTTSNEEYLSASYVVDGLWNQNLKHWAGRGSPNWVRVDLGSNYRINRIKVGPYGNSNRYYYDNAWNIKYSTSSSPNTWRDFSSVNKISGAGSLTGTGINIINGNPGHQMSDDNYKYYEFTFNEVDGRYIRFEVTSGDVDGDSNCDEIEVYSVGSGTTTSTTTPGTDNPPQFFNLRHNPLTVLVGNAVDILVDWFDDVGLQQIIIQENSTGEWRSYTVYVREESTTTTSTTTTTSLTTTTYLITTTTSSTTTTISSGAVWRPFSDSSPWNTPIPNNPEIDPNSATYINYMTSVCGNCPPSTIRNNWGVAAYFIDDDSNYPSTIHVISNSGWWGGSVDAPIPSYAQPDSSSDAHMTVIDRDKGKSWGFWRIQGSYPSITAGSGKEVNLNGDGVTIVVCREAGFSCIAGLVRPEEIESGEIRHALVFALDGQNGWSNFVYPATTGCDSATGPSGSHVPPMGTRLQLKPEVDISHLTGPAQIVARALKKYGMYLGDENDLSTIGIYFQTKGDPDNNGVVESGTELWQGIFTDTDHYSLRSLKITDFRVIKPP